MQSRPIEEFWLAADGDDYSPAFRRAQLQLPAGRSLRITLGNRTYLCATALKLWRPVYIEGVEDTILSFSSDSHGIITCYAGTNLFETHTTSSSDPATDDTTIGDTADAAGVTLKNLTLKGTSATSSTLSHGAVLLTQTILEDVVIKDFSGHGIYSCVTTSGTAPSSLATINTIATFLGVLGDSVIRDCTIQDTGRYSINIRNTGTAAPILTNTKCARSGTSFFSVIHTTSTAITPSSATFSSGSIAVTMSGAGHGFSTGDYAILSAMSQSSVDYNLRCYEISKVSVSGAVVTCPVASTANPAWPTSSTATFGSSSRVARLYSYAPSSVTFSTSGGINVATVELGAAHIFKPNDYVIMQNVSSSSNDKAYSSPRYPRPCRVVSVGATSLVIAPPTGMTFPGSSTATLDSDPRICGIELNVVLNTTAFCNVIDMQCDTPVLGGLQILDESAGTVHLSHYDKGGITRSQHNNTSIVLGGSNLNNTGADKQRSSAAIVKPGGSGILEVQKAVKAYPNYKDYGVTSVLGGATKESLLEFNANYAGTAIHSAAHGFSYEKSTTAKGGGYIEFTNNLGTAGYSSLALPTVTNNRNNKTPLLPAGVYIGGPGTDTSYLAQTSLSAVPKSYGFIGTKEMSGTNDKYTQFLYSDNSNLNVTGAAAGGGLCELTTAAHNFAVGDRVLVTGIPGSPSAHGIFILASVPTTTTFRIPSSTFSSYPIYSATISSIAAGISDGSSDVTTSVITVSGASGTLPVAGERISVGSTATNADALVVAASGSTITVLGDYTGVTGTVTKNQGFVSRLHAVAYGNQQPRDASGSWAKGDLIVNTTPGSSYISGWRCLTGGTGSTSTWEPILDIPFVNGTHTARLSLSRDVYTVTSVANAAGLIQLGLNPSDTTKAAGLRFLVNGVPSSFGTANGAWIASAVASASVNLLGSTYVTNGATVGTACIARAETSYKEPPRSGTWALGDVCINETPLTSYISRWICTAASTAVNDGATWMAIPDVPFVNGSQTASLHPISTTYKISSGAADSGPSESEIRLTLPTHTILNGQRVLVNGMVASAATVNGVWIVKDKTSTTIDLTGSSTSGSYTSSTGTLIAARAITNTSAAPADGTWAIGDVAYNSAPITAGILGWVCTASGTPGTWKVLTISPSITYDSGGILTQTFTIHKAFSAGAGGSPDDVTIFDASPGLPYAICILDQTLIISTGVGASTCTLRDATGGAGNALSGDMDSSGTPAVVRNTGWAPTYPAAGSAIYLRRSDSGVAGEILVTYRIQ